MRIVRFRGEASVEAIADKAYTELSSPLRAKAVKALLRANPQLATLENVREGSVLVIPEVPGVRPAPSRGPEAASEEIGDFLSQALQDYGKTMAARHEAFGTLVKEQQALLKDRQFKNAIGASEAAKELAGQAAKSISAEAKAAIENRKRLEAAIKKLISDFSAPGQ